MSSWTSAELRAHLPEPCKTCGRRYSCKSFYGSKKPCKACDGCYLERPCIVHINNPCDCETCSVKANTQHSIKLAKECAEECPEPWWYPASLMNEWYACKVFLDRYRTGKLGNVIFQNNINNYNISSTGGNGGDREGSNSGSGGGGGGGGNVTVNVNEMFRKVGQSDFHSKNNTSPYLYDVSDGQNYESYQFEQNTQYDYNCFPQLFTPIHANLIGINQFDAMNTVYSWVGVVHQFYLANVFNYFTWITIPVYSYFSQFSF